MAQSELDLTEYPEWFHSIELAPNVVTPGRKSQESLNLELRSLQLPDLRGKSVLDVGAYDGFYSFVVEKLGASRVVALDHYVWSTDMASYMRDWRESKRSGTPLPPPHASRHWKPDELPGRKPFDLARRALQSNVEPVVGDFMSMSLERLGQFDVVLFLGVLYHMENPLEALKRLRSVIAPGGLAVIETEAIEVPGLGSRACCEFFPGRELNNDPTNWWAPNAAGVEALCRGAGFGDVKVLKSGPGVLQRLKRSAASLVKEGLKGRIGLPLVRYRAVAHAINAIEEGAAEPRSPDGLLRYST